MNRIKKKIIVRFFSIIAAKNYFDDFISINNANLSNDKSTRIINIREKKHLIKIHNAFQLHEKPSFFLSVVRERNTWQARALGNGTISGISINQGIIGDPYYFLVVPTDKIVVGFTTGPSGSLRSVANLTLQQFNKDRGSKVALEHISKKKEFSKLKELKGYNKLHFKIDTSSLGEPSEDTPEILKGLSAAPFLTNNSQLALTFTEIGNKGFTEEDLIDIVNYLAENDGCSSLIVQGLDDEGGKVHLDFSKAYALFKTEIKIRDKFIDELAAKEILLQAINSFDQSMLADC